MDVPFAAPLSASREPPGEVAGFRRADPVEAALRAFAQTSAGPGQAFPLVLASVTVAVFSMSLDGVATYSHEAFFGGIALTVVFAIAVAKIMRRIPTTGARTAAAFLLPAAFGALIGMAVQAIVLVDVSDLTSSTPAPVKDLGGLVDTTESVGWVLGGVLLGAVPAVLVSIFLLVAGRALRRLTGHDASESFGVAFTGGTGLVATFGLVVVDRIAMAPLLAVTLASAMTLLLALLVDGSRMRFLRRVYAGKDGDFVIVPAHELATRHALTPMVANAGDGAVLLRVDKNLDSYRAAAAAPIALLPEHESDTLRPLRGRRIAAGLMLGAMGLLSALAAIAHGS